MVDEIRILEQISGSITIVLGIIGTILGPVEIIYTIFDIPKITVKKRYRKYIFGVLSIIIGIRLIALGCDISEENKEQSISQSSETAVSENIHISSNVYASTIPEDQQHYELGVAFKNNEDYKNAILELSKIEASSTYYEEAQKIVDIAKESYVNAVLNEVKQCNSVEDFEKSFQKMYEAEEILEFLTDISLELAETEELYRTSLLKKAEVAFETDGWEEAISVLEEGFEWLPDDSLIESEIRKYEEYAPVYIYNMPIFEGDDWTIYDSVEDNLGNTYNNAVSSSYFKDETRTYKMNGEYKRIKGTLFVRKEERNTDWGTLLQIIGDGNLLYSAQVSGGDEPISFNVDISNIEELSIFYTWMASATYTSGFTAIGDFAVYKN